LQSLFSIQAKAIGLLITNQNIRFIAFEAKEKERIDPNSIISVEEFLRQREIEREAKEADILDQKVEEEEEVDIVSDSKECPPLTIQSKYRLPPMPVKENDEVDREKKENQSQEQNLNSQAKFMSQKEFQEVGIPPIISSHVVKLPDIISYA
jgi:hypothetical protein